MEKIILQTGERLEDLQCKGLKIIQNKDYYTFTSDSVILANFINTSKKHNCVEIGCGCGVISILLSAKKDFSSITAFELQKEMASLAEKNIKLNNLQDKIKIVNDNVLNFDKYIKKANIDIVFSNPPYMKGGEENKNIIRDKARHEKSLPLEDLTRCTSQMLKFGGKFYVVYSAERSIELISSLLKNNLQPKKMFFTSNGKGRVVLVIIEAVKGGKSGVKVLPELVTNEADGKYLEELHTKYI